MTGKNNKCEDGLKLFVYRTGISYGCGIYIAIARSDAEARMMYPDKSDINNENTFEFILIYTASSSETKPRVIYASFEEL